MEFHKETGHFFYVKKHREPPRQVFSLFYSDKHPLFAYRLPAGMAEPGEDLVLLVETSFDLDQLG